MPEPHLSKREREVAILVAEGLTNREIAARLFVAERTAEGHVEQIRNKLGVRSRTEIATWVARGGADSQAGEPLAPIKSVPGHEPPAAASGASGARPPAAPDAVTRVRGIYGFSRWLLPIGVGLSALTVAAVVLDSVVLPRLGSGVVSQPIRTYAGNGKALKLSSPWA